MITTLVFVAIHFIVCSAVGVQRFDGENWLFVGYSNTFFGSTLPHGFINQIAQQVGVITKTAALPYSDTKTLFDLLKHDDFVDLKAQKLFYMVEGEAILSHFSYQEDKGLLTKAVAYPNKVLSDIESVLSYLTVRGTETTLCVMLMAGEDSEENQVELHFEEWKRLLKLASVDYNTSFVDLTLPMDRYNELVNIDNVEHSTLTHDGYILNDKGHTVVANELLSSLSVNSLQQAVDRDLVSLLKRKTPVEEINKLRLKYEQ